MPPQRSRSAHFLLALSAALLCSQNQVLATERASMSSLVQATSSSPPARLSKPAGQQPDGCPFPYPRHSMAALRNGTLPYLLGGSPLPCTSCRPGDIPEFCRFLRPVPDEHRPFQHTAHVCSRGQQEAMLAYLLERDLWEYLQFTPCQLWPLLKGRTLWIIGDSQVRSCAAAQLLP